MFALIFSFPLILFAQVRDDFSDGNFTVDPAWTGDTDEFEVNGSFQLHLKAGDGDTSLLVSENHLGTDCEWNFWVKLSFNTSANNHCRIYLISDTSLLRGPVHGYFLQLGGSRDSMAIFRQDGTEQSEIFRLHAGVLSHSVNTLRFRILRESGLWSVGVDTTGGTNYLDEGTFIENTYTSTSFFGIFVRYTSSNSAKFYFDDIYAGEIVRDTIPPEIISLKVIDERRIAVRFNEFPDNSNVLDTSHYLFLHSNSHPVSALEDPDNGMNIILTRKFEITPETCDTLLISGITDVAGNLMTDTQVVFCLHHAGAFDILINEVMADPAPSVSLPGSEYIELFNRSALPVDMAGWSLDYGTATRVFPDVRILPGAFLILSSDTAFSFLWQHDPTIYRELEPFQ